MVARGEKGLGVSADGNALTTVVTDAHTTQKHIPHACINNCTYRINMHAHTKIYIHMLISVNKDT